MNTRIFIAACAALSTFTIGAGTASAAASLSPTLQTKLASLAPSDSAGLVIISFKTANGLPADLPTFLAKYNITTTRRLSALGMVTAVLTKSQVTALQADSQVLSVWDNKRLYYSLSQARVLCGVDRLRADAAMTAQNGGNVVDGSGKGDAIPGPVALNKPQFSVAVIDSGIDTAATQAGSSVPRDLPFDAITSATGTIPTSKVIQNVQVVPDLAGTGSLILENQINDDTVGHGSHCSGIVGGTGAFSRTLPATSGPNASLTSSMIGKTQDFSGVASGAKIVGLGSGAVLFILGALESFEYVLENQAKYNIRITSNSYGSTGDFDPADPVNLAIETAHANGITSVFAAGNSGPGVDTISNSAKSPYVISVAAGTKEGGLASFSSRGLAAGERTKRSIDSFNLPAITAPGTGREFPENGPADPLGTTGVEPNPNVNAKGFYSDIISTRSVIGGTAAGMNDQEFPTPYQANYTQISGTSMACPFIAGVCALLLDANPNLTPDQIKSILQSTATHTPGYADFETGAGYVNAYAAVDKAFNPSKTYQPFTLSDADYVAKVTSVNLVPPARPAGYPPATTMGDANTGEQFALTYTPSSVAASDYATAKTKAMTTGNNAYAFAVGPDATTGKAPSVIDVRLLFGQDGVAGVAGGNSLGFYLWAPDGTFYASGVALPVLDSPSRQVVVQNPVPGLWVLELRGLRGLATIPVTPPTGVALPDNTTGSIRRVSNTVPEPNDIAEAGQRDAIRAALAARYMDAFPDPKNSGGILFLPTATVTRGDFLKALVINTPLRQSLATTSPRFTDVSATVSRWAEAATQNGSTLRDFDFTPKPVIETSASPSFSPNSAMSRAKAAVAMVRALGLDREAKALRDIPTVNYTYRGVAYPVQDIPAYNPSEPGANQENGYLQLAINRGLLPIVPTVRGTNVTVKATPTRPLVRGDLAIVLNNYRRFFQFGNKFDVATESPIGQTPAN